MQIDDILIAGQEKNASDVHIVVGSEPYIRVDGVLSPLKLPKVTKKQAEDMVFSLLSKEQETRFLKDKELDLAYQTPDKTRYRVNLHWEKGNVSLAARLITAQIPTMEDINMPKVAHDLIKRPAGLVLVTGPAGNGKSTTLAAMIETINRDKASNIITLEDPIEFLFQPKKSIIRQRQLGTDMESFSEGLRHVLRQDPNIIMVGEMRDLDTIATTITLAETGHLVFATLHTYSAAQTIDRIIDSFPPHQQDQIRLQLSMTLQAVLSQRLLPRVGGGRIAVREVLLANPAVSNLIRENKINQIRTVIQTSVKDGMISMDQSMKATFDKGLIEKQVALPFMDNPDLLEE